MKPYNFSTVGGYTQTPYTAAGVPSGSPVFFSGSAMKASLTCSSTVGNFKDPLPFSYKKTVSRSLYGKLIITSANKSYVVRDGYVIGNIYPETYTTRGTALDPYNKCLDKLYAAMRSDVDLSIDIYQGRQTVKMISGFASALLNPTKTLSGALTSLVGNPKWRHLLKGTGGKWLEWQYGLAPTLNTIYALTSELIETVCTEDGFISAKARASESFTDYDGNSSNYAPINGMTTQIEFTDSRRCEISLKYAISDAERNALSQFSSLNPVSFFYENVPFSFVLDWIIDVGGYLRMLETALITGIVCKGGYKTETRQRSLVVGCNKRFKNEYGTIYVPSFPAQESYTRQLTRTVLSELPLPVLPSVKVNLGTARLLSAASLLTNFLKLNPPRRR